MTEYNPIGPHDPHASAPLSVGAGIKTLEGKELLVLIARQQKINDGFITSMSMLREELRAQAEWAKRVEDRVRALEERLKAAP